MRINRIEIYAYQTQIRSQIRYGWFCQWITSEKEVWSEICCKSAVMQLEKMKAKLLAIDWNWASILSDHNLLKELDAPLGSMIALVIFQLLKKKKRKMIAINALAPKWNKEHVCVKWKWNQPIQHEWIRVDFNRSKNVEDFLNIDWDWKSIEYVEEPVNSIYGLEKLMNVYPIALDESLHDWYKNCAVRDLPKVNLIIKAYKMDSMIRMIDMINAHYGYVTFTSNFETQTGIKNQVEFIAWMDLKIPMGFDTIRWIEQVQSEGGMKDEMLCDARILLWD
nr:4-(2'-carboxyphenyl)-4-oxybutyric acid synthase [Cyanidioschyzonaceae sp. 1]